MSDAPRVFVIDDEEKLSSITARFLKSRGYDVTAYTSPTQAVAEALQIHPQLVITDIAMPQMNGVELVDKMRELLPDVKIICISGHATGTTVDTLKSKKINAFLPKPFELKMLQETIETVLGSAATSGSTEKKVEKKSLENLTASTTVGTGAAGKMLVVDDFDPFREVVTLLFSKEGYAVDQASDGREAIDYVERKTYDVIVMDINMPNMSGYEALRRIKAIDKHMMVVMITGEAEADVIKQCEGITGYVCLRKPIDNSDLLAKVKAFDYEGMRKRRAAEIEAEKAKREQERAVREKLAAEAQNFAQKHHLSKKSLTIIIMLIVVGSLFGALMVIDGPKDENGRQPDDVMGKIDTMIKYLHRDENREYLRDSRGR